MPYDNPSPTFTFGMPTPESYSYPPHGVMLPLGSPSPPLPPSIPTANNISTPGLSPPFTPTPNSSTGSAQIIKPLFIDHLAKDFKLDTQQRHNLHAFVQLGSLGEGLSQADLATRLYMLAAAFGEAAERRRIAKESSIDDIKGLFADLKIRLEDTFTFSTEQRANIRGVAQDVIYQANRTSFMTISIDVEKVLRDEKVNMKMMNVFGIPAREKSLASIIRKTCSSVRNAFRQDIFKSISADEGSSLAEFTYDSACKYKRGGPGEKLDIAFTIHNAILRHFGLDNLNLLAVPEAAEDEDNDGGDDSASVGRKRRRRAGGRVPKGQDFWSKVDEFFAREIASRGRNLTQGKWKDYVNDCIRRDNERCLASTPDPSGTDVGSFGASWGTPSTISEDAVMAGTTVTVPATTLLSFI